jgi:hypothetical protein
LVPEATGYDVDNPLVEPPSETLTGPTVYIFLPERLDELGFVEQAYPGGKVVVKRGREQIHLFTAYQIQ